MANSGFFGFVVDGAEKIAYEHDYADPKGLGLNTLRFLRAGLATNAQAAHGDVKALRVVTDADIPTPEDVAALALWTDLRVGRQSTDDWYCLLRGTQSHPAYALIAGVILDATDFALDGLWVDWGYIADFDTCRFEVYQGQPEHAGSAGRFAGRPHHCTSGYTSVLARSWPFEALPSDRTFVRGLYALRDKQMKAAAMS